MRNSKREKVWSERYVFGDETRDTAVRNMAKALGTSELFAVLLYNRGHNDAEGAKRFLNFEEAGFYDPYRLKDMDRAVNRIFEAVENSEKICIYGDYDVDGVTSVSMLYLYLTSLGANVCIKIPKREGEGYGVSSAAVEQLANSDVKLIVTVDTGITAAAEVEYAKTLGIDFVVTDHHECRAELPAAVAVVNPHRPDCEYPFAELAGVGVVFKLVCACKMQENKQNGKTALEAVRDICKNYADLAALGTIADVMPIVDENRLIVSMGLHQMEVCPREGIAALIDASSSKKGDDGKKKKINSGFIGFGLAPRINAAGRISDATKAVDLLLAKTQESAYAYAEELCAINRRRQLEENAIAEEAYKKIEDMPEGKSEYVIVLDSNTWQQGIIGIVASKITEKYGLPSILVSFDGSVGEEESPFDDGKGSGRSIKGLNLVEALAHCEDLLIKYGGHELAAGLSLKRCDLEAFTEKINEYAKQRLDEEALKIKLEADCELKMKDVNLDFAKELERLEPYGTGNATPLFVMKNVLVKKAVPTRGGDHVRLTLEADGIQMNAMYFGITVPELGFENGDGIDLLFNVDINDYKNSLTAQMIVRDARLSDECRTKRKGNAARYAELHNGGTHFESEDFVPDRDDCAKVYNYMRREYRLGNTELRVENARRTLNCLEGKQINYVKLKYILDIFNELKICNIEESEYDVYSFELVFGANKTNIEKSSILKRLKTQCIRGM